MKKFSSYLDKEKAEEKSGIDLDHDNEKGESEEHKKKVEQKKKEIIEFFEKRKSGAMNIASEARAKGGPSILTAWHFSAKNHPYIEVLHAIRTNKDETFFMQKCRNLISKIKPDKMTQKEFQEIMGELEVYGEALTKIFGE